MDRLVFHSGGVSFVYDVPVDEIPHQWHAFLTEHKLLPALNETTSIGPLQIAHIADLATELCKTVKERVGASIHAVLHVALMYGETSIVTHRYDAEDRMALLFSSLDRQSDKVKLMRANYALLKKEPDTEFNDELRRLSRLQAMYDMEKKRNEH